MMNLVILFIKYALRHLLFQMKYLIMFIVRWMNFLSMDRSIDKYIESLNLYSNFVITLKGLRGKIGFQLR